ncbi:MAG: serine/threonine-protein kinase [Proteobacteria bacterium]|nr:serine/threonine-protein kinase [Pseudomonadota bacterium]
MLRKLPLEQVAEQPLPFRPMFRNQDTVPIGEGRRLNGCCEERALDKPDNLPRPGDTIDHYELIRELGRGGMGVVYLARDTKLARLVAIKFLLDKHARLSDRFLIEARATARCHHENIVIIHDVNRYRDHSFMVLEYLPGQPLRALLDRGPLPAQRAVELMIPVLRALARAHAHGIIHRDLKPENVFVTDTGAIKVVDFGIAKVLSGRTAESMSWQVRRPDPCEDIQLTPAGGLLGTLPYMSPEQLRGSDIDQCADLWAVGIMLYEMVAGGHPLRPLSAKKLFEMTDRDDPIPSASERLPEIGQLGSLIDRCLMARKADRISSASELLDELESFASAGHTTTLSDGESPFTGLSAFQESDADRLFGRAQETVGIAAQVRRQPLVTVMGPSGTGKSSLIRAGVISALKRSGEGWKSLVIRPGRRPLGALADALMHADTGSGNVELTPDGRDRARRSDLVAGLRDQPGYFGAVLRGWAGRKQCRFVILIDQFEELYTLGADDGERAAFIQCLEGAADDAGSPLRLVVTIRSDFLERAVNARDYMADFAQGLTFLPPMDRAHLRQALTAPVEAANCRYETDELVEDILDGLEATPGALPLLQFAASKLWQARDRENRLLTRASYNAMGGIAGTLASHADAVMTTMTGGKLALARAIFQRLVTPERARAVASIDELCDLPGDSDDIEHVVHHLADARLLAIEDGADRGSSTVELIHESLIDSWPTLRRWPDDNQEGAEFLARIRVASQEWQRSGRAAGMLWRGEPARQARAWHARYEGELSDRDRLYLDAVFALSHRTTRVKRAAIVGTIVFLALIAVAALVAVVALRQAEYRAEARAAELAEQLEKNNSLIAQRSELLRQEQTARQRAEKTADGARQAEAEAREAEKDARASAAGWQTLLEEKRSNGRLGRWPGNRTPRLIHKQRVSVVLLAYLSSSWRCRSL